MKKINVKLMKAGSENDVITRMIANMNEGKGVVTPRDFEGYINTRNVMFPTINDYKLVKDTDDPDTYHVSEDGGKTFTLSMEWVEVVELKTESVDDLNNINIG